MSAWGWWRPPACWTASTATTKRLEWILSCFNKFPVTRHSDRPFGVHAFDFLSVRGREDPDRQVHLTEIEKMLSIPLWYKQWCCNLVKKLWMPNSFYMICGCIIALSIGDLDRGWHLRWDRLVLFLQQHFLVSQNIINTKHEMVIACLQLKWDRMNRDILKLNRQKSRCATFFFAVLENQVFFVSASISEALDGCRAIFAVLIFLCLFPYCMLPDVCCCC